MVIERLLQPFYITPLGVRVAAVRGTLKWSWDR
jgi:hypothetical protein